MSEGEKEEGNLGRNEGGWGGVVATPNLVLMTISTSFFQVAWSTFFPLALSLTLKKLLLLQAASDALRGLKKEERGRGLRADVGFGRFQGRSVRNFLNTGEKREGECEGGGGGEVQMQLLTALQDSDRGDGWRTLLLLCLPLYVCNREFRFLMEPTFLDVGRSSR